MNVLDAEVVEIVKVYQSGEYWYVDYKYNVWGSIKQSTDRFKYLEDAEKFTVGTVIKV